MSYLLGIPFVNRPDLLAAAVRSIEPCWPQALIVDNAEELLDPAAWPIPLFRPPVPLTFSQTMNLLQRLAVERGAEVVLLMHNDAEAAPGTPEALLAAAGAATAAGRRWGAIWTNYDALAAYSLRMVADVGQWDTTLPQYFADNDYYRRIVLAGYELVDSGLPVVHHASSTITTDPRRRFLNGITFPLYEQYYVAKWGGPPGGERFARPFDGAI